MEKQLAGIRLWPENKKRLDALVKKVPLLSLNKAANMVLAFSLHRFEQSLDWISKTPPTK